MTTFDNREKAFEDMFAHDAELKFKAKARRIKLLGAWAAQRLGLEGEAAAALLQRLRSADLTPAGDDEVLRSLAADFKAKSIENGQQELRAKFDQFLAQAVQLVESGG